MSAPACISIGSGDSSKRSQLGVSRSRFSTAEKKRKHQGKGRGTHSSRSRRKANAPRSSDPGGEGRQEGAGKNGQKDVMRSEKKRKEAKRREKKKKA